MCAFFQHILNRDNADKRSVFRAHNNRLPLVFITLTRGYGIVVEKYPALRKKPHAANTHVAARHLSLNSEAGEIFNRHYIVKLDAAALRLVHNGIGKGMR